MRIYFFQNDGFHGRKMNFLETIWKFLSEKNSMNDNLSVMMVSSL